MNPISKLLLLQEFHNLGNKSEDYRVSLTLRSFLTLSQNNSVKAQNGVVMRKMDIFF
jgi:hypothetical protein|tara:strand:- start:744 stop:914 length:171 start_codon:yes stop_codon:yes gene_type:complete